MVKGRHRKRSWMIAAGGAAVAAAGGALWVRRQFVAITVEGMSMSPGLYPDDRVLIRRGTKGLAVGRIVVVARPQPGLGWKDAKPAGRDLKAQHWYIKRVVAVAGDPYPESVGIEGDVPPGNVVIIGDHQHSEDSKQHGPCPVDQILGVMVRKLQVGDKQALGPESLAPTLEIAEDLEMDESPEPESEEKSST